MIDRRPSIRGKRKHPRSGGFTLVELLVVILIVLIVSAVALPVVLPALSNRQVNEAARLVQSALAGAKDAAIRANERRGIRLIPDQTLTTAPFTDSSNVFHPGVLTYSRLVPIEPGPDYIDGSVSIIYDAPGNPFTSTYYSRYPSLPPNQSANLPYPSGGPQPLGSNSFAAVGVPVPKGRVLRIEECRFTVINYNSATGPTANPIPIPNARTNWWWNIRIGDKIQINGTGRAYTVVGPLLVFPQNPATPNQNPELFVNDGPPGTTSSLFRNYPGVPKQVDVEFLYVVNGQDDDGDGYIDDGYDGVDNDYDNPLVKDIDDVTHHFDGSGNLLLIGEWETEQWVGSLQVMNNPDNPKIYNTVNAAGILTGNDPSNPGYNLPYSITRRPVVSPGVRETILPGPVVIDATTWNSTQERSRLPIDPSSYTVDIMFDPLGQVVPQTLYSSNSSFAITESFYHLWITDRTDVYDPGAFSTFPTLPLPSGSPNYPPTASASYNPILQTTFLKKDRQLVTLYTKTGQIVTKSIESFNGLDVNAPFYESQLGIREVK
jgi:prepilin-type N-terminal cleavage/methylation domain-containing protein